MRVNSVDQNTNFKALKISPKLKPQMAEKGQDFVNKLEEYGKQISDVIRYNVIFEDSLTTPKIRHADGNIMDDLFAMLKKEERFLGRHYEVPCGVGGETRGGFYPDEPQVFKYLYGKNAAERYKEFKQLNIYDQAAEYCRILEKKDAKKYFEATIQEMKDNTKKRKETIEKEVLTKSIDDLVDKYEYKQPDSDFPKKKNWFRRIFG